MTDADRAETPETEEASRFARQAEEPQVGILYEFCLFLRYNKKWWLAPILIVLLLMGAVLWVGATAAAPFIYTLF